MQLYCKDGVVLATHDDDQHVPASAYGAGVVIVPYHGSVDDLPRVGDLPEDWPEGMLDTRPRAMPMTAEVLAGYARRRSWEAETAGITVAGAVVATDRESQSLVNGMYALATRDPTRAFRFDGLSGPVTLTAEQAIALAVAVGDHVQAAFAKRADVLAGIEAGTITTTAEIDAAFAAL